MTRQGLIPGLIAGLLAAALACCGGGGGTSLPETPSSISLSAARASMQGLFHLYRPPAVYILPDGPAPLARAGARSASAAVIVDHGGHITVSYPNVAAYGCRFNTPNLLRGDKNADGTVSISGSVSISSCTADPFWENGVITFSETRLAYDQGTNSLGHGTVNYSFSSGIMFSNLAITGEFETQADGSGRGVVARRRVDGSHRYTQSLEFVFAAHGGYQMTVTGNSAEVMGFNLTLNSTAGGLVGSGRISTEDSLILDFCNGCIVIGPQSGVAEFVLNNNFAGRLNFDADGSGDGQIANNVGEPVADLSWNATGLVTVNYRDETLTDHYQL